MKGIKLRIDVTQSQMNANYYKINETLHFGN